MTLRDVNVFLKLLNIPGAKSAQEIGNIYESDEFSSPTKGARKKAGERFVHRVETYFNAVPTLSKDFKFVIHNSKEYSTDQAGKKSTRKSVKYSFDRVSSLNAEDVLIIAKLLMASRSLNKEELDDLLKKLRKMVSSEEEKIINSAINETSLNNQFISEKNNRRKIIWQLESDILSKTNIRFSYLNKETSQNPTKINVDTLPVHVFFDNFYFFVIGYTLLENNKREYRTYRIDWISEFEEDTKSSYFPEQRELLDHSRMDPKNVYGYQGRPTTAIFEYYGFTDYVKDKFPNAEISKKNLDRKSEFDFPVKRIRIPVNYSDGFMLWALSQTTIMKLTSPTEKVGKFEQTPVESTLIDSLQLYHPDKSIEEITDFLNS